MRTISTHATLYSLAAAALLLSACGNDDSPRQQAVATSTSAVDAAAGIAPAAGDVSPGVIAVVAAPSSTAYPVVNPDAYLGVWAPADADGQTGDCNTMWWNFSPTGLTTAGENACTFATPTISGNTFTMDANCRAEGLVTKETYRLTFPDAQNIAPTPMGVAQTAQDARPSRMIVQRGTLPPVTLARCGAS